MSRNFFTGRLLEIFIENTGMSPDEAVRLSDEERNRRLEEHTGRNYPLDIDCVGAVKQEVYEGIMQLGPRGCVDYTD